MLVLSAFEVVGRANFKDIVAVYVDVMPHIKPFFRGVRGECPLSITSAFASAQE
jgi:hypothetical protein